MLLKFLLSYPGLLAAEEVLKTEVFRKESLPKRDLKLRQDQFNTGFIDWATSKLAVGYRVWKTNKNKVDNA